MLDVASIDLSLRASNKIPKESGSARREINRDGQDSEGMRAEG